MLRLVPTPTRLDQRLTARALRLAMAPDFGLAAAARSLAAASEGDRTALELALARVHAGSSDRASRVAQRAAAALGLAVLTTAPGCCDALVAN